MFKFFKNKQADLSDKVLLEQFRSTESLDVLSSLYERYVELVYGLCLKYLSDPTKAEDAVMEIFEELTKKVLQHDIDNFKSWLYVLAKNHCLMKIRVRKKEKSDSVDPQFMQSEENWHPITEEPKEGLPIKDLKYCLESLSEMQQTCVEKFFLEGMTYKEIAELLQFELGKVRSYIQNGKRNLKICMEQKALENES